MNGLIRASLKNPHAITVGAIALMVVGWLTMRMIPIDILPVFKSPATQTLTFYRGMPAEDLEKSITNRMERGTAQASGMARLESRSIQGVSVIRNYFQTDADPDGALTQVNALATLEIPTLPPGTLPPVIMPFDPTGTMPVCLVALNSPTQTEQSLYDVGRYEVRPMIMSNPGAVAPVVFGGTIRTIMIYMDRIKMQARQLAPTDVMRATDAYNVFLPNGSIKLGDYDYAVSSNSLFNYVDQMGDIPLRSQLDNSAFLRDVARPADAAFIQTNVVRVNGRRQVYVPVYRQGGASTLTVVNTLRENLAEMQGRLSKPDVALGIVMDQSVYVRNSITALIQEGALGAVLCSLVILLFLGQWRMTMIAVITIPLAVVSAVICLYATGQTINVMTLAGLALAIGPLVDSAIICLENTHRHLGMGADSSEAAFLGASEVAMPELVSTLCTFLVLAPLVVVPGMGRFLFLPMAMGVAFAMISAYFLSRTLVPSFSGLFLKPHAAGHGHVSSNPFSRAFAAWEATIDRGIALYVRGLNWVLVHRWLTVAIGFGFLAVTLVTIGPNLRREFFPEVDAGAFEIAVRAPTGIRIEVTEKYVAEVEKFIHDTIPEHDLELVVSELGVTPDWSAAYTPNAGPMDAMIRIQLREHRQHSAQEYVNLLRTGLTADHKFSNLELAFDAGGMVRGALNEGKSSPLTVRVVGKDARMCYRIADNIKRQITAIDGVVDARIIQRMDYPQFVINVDRAKSANLGLTQADIMRNVVAACNSSISFNKTNFWIDPKSHNQYFVGVQYPENDITSIDTLLDIPVTGSKQLQPVPLRSVATLTRTTVPSEITHYNIQPTIELTMNIHGRSLGEVSDDVTLLLDGHGRRGADGSWAPYDPKLPGKTLVGSKIVLSGEYARMQETFRNLSVGLLLAALLMYCLMVGLDRSWVVPLTVMLVVPVSLAGVLVMLYFTGTALNVQSLLGIIFVVGIKVANTVLMTDFAQELRRHEGLSPLEAIRKAAAVRVRPVTMTALAAFFAMIPAAIAWERGSEANAPLARAILGGLLAGEPATLFLLPALFAILVRDKHPRLAAAEVADPHEHPTAGE